MKKRYAVIARVRMQVSGCVNKPEIVNSNFNIVVDLQEHPQKDEVGIDWFYDEETNSFSIEGEVHYPEPEPEPEPAPLPLSDQEQIAIDTALNVEYMVCLMEAGMGLM